MKNQRFLFLTLCLVVGLDFALAIPDWRKREEDHEEYCTTFEQKPGRIIGVNECAYMLDIVVRLRKNQQLTERERNILRFSRRSNFPMAVCCEDLINTSGLELLKENEGKCGQFQINTIVNGREINMGTRPWMALLEYKDRNYKFQCGATLITQRYLLTAAHCVNSDLISARLGEHKISENPDCKNYGSEFICMPPHQDIAVEKAIVHKKFSGIKLIYDIALIRLKTPANIIDNVKTICLPLYDDVQRSIRRRSVQQVTGWGVQNDGVASDVPNEAAVTRVPLNECHTGRDMPLLGNQMCFNATGPDSCDGDSGGPLSFPYIYRGHQRFVQMGIVSYGPGICGSGPTAVYTDVISFLPWITQNIEP